MNIYTIEKPKINEVDLPSVIRKFIEKKGSFSEILEKTANPKYLYWDKIKHKKIYKFLTREEVWVITKFLRQSQAKKTAITAENGDVFTWQKVTDFERIIHDLDLNTGGQLFSSRFDINDKTKYQFISRGIMEEAIASSQLEGANTTRKVAKKFLREGRKPKNRAEQMILNNYTTMMEIEEEFKNKEMTLDLLRELHSRLTEKTIEKEHQGNLRKDSDEVVVGDINNIIYHIPPKMNFVKKELKKLILYSNDKLEEDFTHPIVKAILIHFWLGYLHPFCDGNGRLARILFYWYLLKHDYWAFSYLPISKRIKMSTVQYKMAYIYSEQDDCDLTYFIDYNLRKIILATIDLKKYIDSRYSENVVMNRKAKLNFNLNDRQIAVVQYFLGNPFEKITSIMHCNTHQVSRITAFKDLKKMEDLGFLISKKQGRNVFYFPTEKIKELS